MSILLRQPRCGPQPRNCEDEASPPSSLAASGGSCSFSATSYFPTVESLCYCVLLLIAVVLWEQLTQHTAIAWWESGSPGGQRLPPQTVAKKTVWFSCALAAPASGGSKRLSVRETTVARANDRRTQLHSAIEAQINDGLHSETAKGDEASMEALLQMLSTKGLLAKAAAGEEEGEAPASPTHLPLREWGIPDAEALRSTRILLVGDAATTGLAKDVLPKFPGGANSFRRPLWKMLRRSAAHKNVSFVGPFKMSHLGPPPSADFAPHHAGKYALTAQEFDTTRARLWVESYQPDIVVVLLGANDLGQHYLAQYMTPDSTESSTQAIFRVLAHVRSAVAKVVASTPPSTLILVSTLLPTTHPFSHLVPGFNLALEAMLLRTPLSQKGPQASGSQGAGGTVGASSLHLRDVLIEDSELFSEQEAQRILRMPTAQRKAHLKVLYEQREATNNSPIYVPEEGAPATSEGAHASKFMKRRVFVIDGANGMDTKKHLLDGIVPNEVGEELVAANMFQAIADAVALHRIVYRQHFTTLREAAKSMLRAAPRSANSNQDAKCGDGPDEQPEIERASSLSSGRQRATQATGVADAGRRDPKRAASARASTGSLDDEPGSDPQRLESTSERVLLPHWLAALAFTVISLILATVVYTKLTLGDPHKLHSGRRLPHTTRHLRQPSGQHTPTPQCGHSRAPSRTPPPSQHSSPSDQACSPPTKR